MICFQRLNEVIVFLTAHSFLQNAHYQLIVHIEQPLFVNPQARKDCGLNNPRALGGELLLSLQIKPVQLPLSQALYNVLPNSTSFVALLLQIEIDCAAAVGNFCNKLGSALDVRSTHFLTTTKPDISCVSAEVWQDSHY